MSQNKMKTIYRQILQICLILAVGTETALAAQETVFLFQMRSAENSDPIITVSYIIGLLIAITIAGLIGALFIKLGVRIIAKKTIPLGKPFIISFFSFLALFIVKGLLNNPLRNSGDSSSSNTTDSNIILFLSVAVFFLVSWLLNVHFIKYTDDEDSQSYGKAFIVTTIQTAALIVVSIISVIGLRLFAHIGERSKYTHYLVSSAPRPAPGKGNVVGTVIWNGKTVANAEVTLCKGTSGSPSSKEVYFNCHRGELKTKTDGNGDFIFANVEPDLYGLKVKAFDSDFYIAQNGSYATLLDFGSTAYKVAPNETVQTDDQHIFKNDLKVIVPPAAGEITKQPLTFSWETYPNATHYFVRFKPFTDKNLKMDSTIICSAYNKKTECAAEKSLPEGVYIWSVEAYTDLSDSRSIMVAVSSFDETQANRIAISSQQNPYFVILPKSPKQDENIAGKNVLIEWEKDVRAANYQIAIFDSKKNYISEATTKENKFSLKTELKPGKYTYEIKAYSADKVPRLIGTSGTLLLRVN